MSPPASVSPAVIDYILPTASLLTVALLTYIARTFSRFRAEHHWLMEITKEHSEQISENTTAIRRMLEQREKLIEQVARPAPSPRRR